MLRKTQQAAPPSGIRLQLFRVPIYFYRAGLGFVFGARFILLKHRGRASGQLRETVIEVIDSRPSEHKIYCASGFGTQSQWYRNIVADHNVQVTYRNVEYHAHARVIEPDEASRVLLRYANAHPRSIKAVARLSGYTMDGSESDIVEFSNIIKVIEFSLREPVRATRGTAS